MSDNVKLNSLLSTIQQKLNAPKSQFNSFGKYSYRSCEDILTAVKPLLGNLSIIINDEIVEVGGRVYVKATATITDGNDYIAATAYAREPENKKGMDESQITGSTSSYARKYALNGLLLIDDNKDADSQDNRLKENNSATSKHTYEPPTEKQLKLIRGLLVQLGTEKEVRDSLVIQLATTKQASHMIEDLNERVKKRRENNTPQE